MSVKNYTLTLPSDTEIVMEREFDAPPALVFRAYTDPELIKQWMGFRTLETVVDKWDPTPGGEYRWFQVTPDGTEQAFRGHFKVIEPPTKLVNTFEWEGMPGHIVETTLIFTDLGGRTRLTATDVYASKEDRDGIIAYGMEEGAAETWNRLNELVVRLNAES